MPEPDETRDSNAGREPGASPVLGASELFPVLIWAAASPQQIAAMQTISAEMPLSTVLPTARTP